MKFGRVVQVNRPTHQLTDIRISDMTSYFQDGGHDVISRPPVARCCIRPLPAIRRACVTSVAPYMRYCFAVFLCFYSFQYTVHLHLFAKCQFYILCGCLHADFLIVVVVVIVVVIVRSRIKNIQ